MIWVSSHYFCFAYCFILQKKKISVSFISWYGMKNMGNSIASTFVTFVSLVSGKKMAQILFLVPVFLVTFVSNISSSSRKRKSLFLSFHDMGWRIWSLPLRLPLLFVSLVSGKMMAQILFLVTLVSPISSSSRKRKFVFLLFHDMGWRIMT